jgi:hypothetical protein
MNAPTNNDFNRLTHWNDQKLTQQQQNATEEIFFLLTHKKNNQMVKIEPNFLCEDDQISILFNKILAVVQTSIPNLESTKKGSFCFLNEKIKFYTLSLNEDKETLNEWQAIIDEKLGIFRESLPQGQAHMPDENYNKIGENQLQFNTNLRFRIKQIQSLEESKEIKVIDQVPHSISDHSKKILVNAYDFDLEYLNTIISNFNTQRINLNAKKISLFALKDELLGLQNKFITDFSRLEHYKTNGRSLLTQASFLYKNLWISEASLLATTTHTHLNEINPLSESDESDDDKSNGTEIIYIQHSEAPLDKPLNVSQKKLILELLAKKVNSFQNDFSIEGSLKLLPYELLPVLAWIPCSCEKRMTTDAELKGKIQTLNNNIILLCNKLVATQDFAKIIKISESIKNHRDLLTEKINDNNKDINNLNNSIFTLKSELIQRIDLERERIDFKEKNLNLREDIPTIPLAEIEQLSIYLGVSQASLSKTVKDFQDNTYEFNLLLKDLIQNKTILDENILKTNVCIDELIFSDFYFFLSNQSNLPLSINFNDLFLFHKIKTIIASYKKHFDKFRLWQIKIKEYLSLNNQEEVRTHFEIISKDYNEFCVHKFEGKLEILNMLKKKLILEITKLLEERSFIPYREDSLEFIASFNDNVSSEYLKNNISNYYYRKEKFQQKKNQLEEIEKKLENEEENFKKIYACLNYMLIEKTANLPKNFFDLPKDLQTKYYPKPILPDQKTISIAPLAEENYPLLFICFLPFHYKQKLLSKLPQQCQNEIAQKERKTKEQIAEYNNTLDNLLIDNFSNKWIKKFIDATSLPLDNAIKLENDKNLGLEADNLIIEIKTITDEVNPKLLAYKEIWDETSKIISGNRDSNTSNNLNRLINSLNINNKLDYLIGTPKISDLARLRDEALTYYVDITTKYLYGYVKKYNKLKSDLTTRIEAGSKNCDSKTIEITGLVHDVKTNLNISKKSFTDISRFKTLLLELEKLHNFLNNDIIYEFCKSFDYFSYLLKYGYSMTSWAFFSSKYIIGSYKYCARNLITPVHQSFLPSPKVLVIPNDNDYPEQPDDYKGEPTVGVFTTESSDEDSIDEQQIQYPTKTIKSEGCDCNGEGCFKCYSTGTH